jgi:hypothetical protein
MHCKDRANRSGVRITPIFKHLGVRSKRGQAQSVAQRFNMKQK